MTGAVEADAAAPNLPARTGYRAGWALTPAFYRAAAICVAAIGLGLSTGRVDAIVIAAPVAVALVLAAATTRWRALVAPETVSGVSEEIVAGGSVEVGTDVRAGTGAELITVHLPDSLSRPTGRSVSVSGDADVRLGSPVSGRTWGPTVVARPDFSAAGPDALIALDPQPGAEVRELVLPAVSKMSPLPLPPISGGWGGVHASRRPGQGNDLIDLRDFRAGDRMRSVHWRAFARQGRMYTRRTMSDADAELMICLDTRADIGPNRAAPPTNMPERLAAGLVSAWDVVTDVLSGHSVGTRRRERAERNEIEARSSLDLTVDAAAAIAGAHLRAGDRVGIGTVCADRVMLRPAGSMRHLQHIRLYLARSRVTRFRIAPPSAWGLRPGAVVVVISPLSDTAIVDAIGRCAARGHQVIVVDSLPQQQIVRAANDTDRWHLRLLTVDRELRIETLRRAAIPVVSWESGGIEAALAGQVRAAGHRRGAGR